jgi:hypothetical protein
MARRVESLVPIGKRNQLLICARFSARPLRDQTHRERVYRPFQFHERSQYFIGTHDEPLSVAVRVRRSTLLYNPKVLVCLERD